VESFFFFRSLLEHKNNKPVAKVDTFWGRFDTYKAVATVRVFIERDRRVVMGEAFVSFEEQKRPT
jgi:hypothetical protein